MNTSESFFRQFPELRGVDPAQLRELIADAEIFDELLVDGVETLEPAERAKVDAIRERLKLKLDKMVKGTAPAAPKATPPRKRELVSLGTFGGSSPKHRTVDAPRGSYLATKRGWLALRFGELTQLAAGVAVAGGTEFFMRVLQSSGTSSPVMSTAPLGVDLVEPGSGTLRPTDDCTISTLEPWHFEATEGGGFRLVGTVAFDYVFDEAPAIALDGGAALACFVASDGEDARCIRARLRREGTRLVAGFDEVLPGLTEAPKAKVLTLRYRLVPPGEDAELVLGA